MGHTNHHLWYHIVWTTKNREHLFTREFWKTELGVLLFQVAKDALIEKYFINGYKEHVHVLMRLKPSQTLSQVVQKLKGVSSNKINNGNFFEGKFEWQEGYSVFTVSPNNVPKVIHYIKYQWEKHETMDFTAEMEAIDRSCSPPHHQPRT